MWLMKSIQHRVAMRRGSQKVSGEFVVARRDTPPVLDATEVALDGVAAPINAFGTIGFLGGIAAGTIGRAPSSLICWRTFSLS